MEPIEITQLTDFPDAEFEVTVQGGTVTSHKVTLSREYYEQLTATAVPAEELIRTSFEFLLSREPNTAILSEFNLAMISQYFPDYEREIRKRLQPGV